MEISVLEHKPGRLIVNGDLTFANVNKQTIKLFSFLNQPQKIILDLRHVANSDSAGLALIIEWLKLARQQQIELVFENTPIQLLSIARLSGLELMNRLTK